MSGTGKSSIIENLRARGYCAVDTDYDNWKVFSEVENEWILNEEKLLDLLKTTREPLFVSGCCSNQWRFYKYFDHVVLVSASLETMLDRVSKRQSNTYGKTAEERNEIIWNFEYIQPRLKETADIEYDTQKNSIEEITDALTDLISK